MLSEEQKLLILSSYQDNPAISLNDLVNKVFPDKPELDGRSKEGRAVRAYLTSHSIIPKTTTVYEKKAEIELSDEQKEFITNNCKTMRPFEMAKVLFNNDKLTTLNSESKAVAAYYNSIPIQVRASEGGVNPMAAAETDYKPPTNIDRAITRVNKYVLNGFDKVNLKPSEKKGLEALINYLHTYRFCHQINTYSEECDRSLFESSFIRYTYDKPDLTQEEVDQYIVLCTDIVIASSIQRRVVTLEDLLDNSATDTEGRRISMSLVESISTAQTEYNQCLGRQQKILSDLKVKRSQRLTDKINETASILNLIALWKEEESRTNLLKLAELRKKAIKQEVERLSSLDEVKCKILGISEEEILNG